MIIQENFLHDENSYSLTELGASLHNSKAQGDDFGCKEEVNDIG